MSEKEKTVVRNYGSLGFGGLLTIVFITLKLLGVIDWNWFWVLSPIVLPLLIVIALIIIVAICMAIKDFVGKKNKND